MGDTRHTGTPDEPTNVVDRFWLTPGAVLGWFAVWALLAALLSAGVFLAAVRIYPAKHDSHLQRRCHEAGPPEHGCPTALDAALLFFATVAPCVFAIGAVAAYRQFMARRQFRRWHAAHASPHWRFALFEPPRNTWTAALWVLWKAPPTVLHAWDAAEDGRGLACFAVGAFTARIPKGVATLGKARARGMEEIGKWPAPEGLVGHSCRRGVWKDEDRDHVITQVHVFRDVDEDSPTLETRFGVMYYGASDPVPFLSFHETQKEALARAGRR